MWNLNQRRRYEALHFGWWPGVQGVTSEALRNKLPSAFLPDLWGALCLNPRCQKPDYISHRQSLLGSLSRICVKIFYGASKNKNPLSHGMPEHSRHEQSWDQFFGVTMVRFSVWLLQCCSGISFFILLSRCKVLISVSRLRHKFCMPGWVLRHGK